MFSRGEGEGSFWGNSARPGVVKSTGPVRRGLREVMASHCRPPNYVSTTIRIPRGVPLEAVGMKLVKRAQTYSRIVGAGGLGFLGLLWGWRGWGMSNPAKKKQHGCAQGFGSSVGNLQPYGANVWKCFEVSELFRNTQGREPPHGASGPMDAPSDAHHCQRSAQARQGTRGRKGATARS